MANILDTAVAAGTFTNLVAAVQAAGLADHCTDELSLLARCLPD